jgi:hypothetical protein
LARRRRVQPRRSTPESLDARSWHKACSSSAQRELRASRIAQRNNIMPNLLWTVAIVLFILWVLGFSLHFTMGGLIHVLLAVAIVVVLVRVITGRRVT